MTNVSFARLKRPPEQGPEYKFSRCIAALLCQQDMLKVGPRILSQEPALLRKSPDGRSSPVPGQIYPTISVTGMPRAVKPFRTATLTWNSAI